MPGCLAKPFTKCRGDHDFEPRSDSDSPHQIWPFHLKSFQRVCIIASVCIAIIVHLIIYLWHYRATGTFDDSGVIKAASVKKLKAAGIDKELMKDTHDLLLDAALKDAGINKPGERLRLIRDARKGGLSADMIDNSLEQSKSL